MNMVLLNEAKDQKEKQQNHTDDTGGEGEGKNSHQCFPHKADEKDHCRLHKMFQGFYRLSQRKNRT